MDYEKLSLTYHEAKPHGKIGVHCVKPLSSQEDLSLAYSPGVAGPCREIHKNREDSFKYTIRGNLVGVISNGTAVLGLGNIGPYAAKPVMEGKAMLFKKFAGIDVFDLEVDATDPQDFIKVVKSLEPTFGGINLEDIKAPDCFYIEEALQQFMSIPVFHDDQHGTAIIAAAAYINACELTQRDITQSKVVFCGAGAAAFGCLRIFKLLGIKDENLILCDSKGVIHSDRDDLNEFKRKYARKTSARTLEDALDGADFFLGVSVAKSLKPSWLKKMAKDPIVFALANPDPEILPEEARSARKDVIIATGRSDFPNQVNNVLGFPYIFRGALDVRAKGINDLMKLEAAKAIALIAKKEIPEKVRQIYNLDPGMGFCRDYIIPKPIDRRVLLEVAPAVAKAAMDSGMARIQVNIEEYKEELRRLLGVLEQE
jgi:malate dehydrogenase (oxaloacetate-decarboxylating)(NADP+)